MWRKREEEVNQRVSVSQRIRFVQFPARCELPHAMASRILLLSLAAASAASAPPPSAADPNRFAGSKPNVIILFADDFGWGDVGQNAPGVVFETAALDALAAGGAHFTDFHTFPLCTPSRGQLLTGRLPIRTGVTTNFVPESLAGLPTTELTIAELLKTAGYDTAQLGKWCVACARARACARTCMRAHARLLTFKHPRRHLFPTQAPRNAPSPPPLLPRLRRDADGALQRRHGLYGPLGWSLLQSASALALPDGAEHEPDGFGPFGPRAL